MRHWIRCQHRGATASIAVRSVIALGALIAMSATVAAETLQIGGTGAALGAMRVMADAYTAEHPDVTVIVHPSLGSGGGIRALNERAIDLALSARPLKDKERSTGARQFEYARTPFVLAVNAQLGITSIGRDDLPAIYRGDKARWPDGTRVRLVLRPADDSDTRLLSEMSRAMDEAIHLALNRSGMIITSTDQENADRLETLSGAMGTSTLAQIIAENRAVRALALDGVTPSPEALAAGTYPWSKSLYLITPADPSPAAQGFVAFVTSAKGREVLTETGHVPLPVR